MIGSNFGNELEAAGLAGLPISWGFDGVQYAEGALTAQQEIDLQAVIAAHEPNTSTALNSQLTGVSDLFDQKIKVGFSFDDPDTNPQIFIADEKGQRWLDRAALRARKSKSNNENRTFKMRASGVKVMLSDDELIDVASDLFDWATMFDDVAQTHNDLLRDIAEGAGTDEEKANAINAYDITIGW